MVVTDAAPTARRATVSSAWPALVPGARREGDAGSGHICLIDLKVARLTHDPRHLDSITDIAGYAGILAEVLDDA